MQFFFAIIFTFMAISYAFKPNRYCNLKTVCKSTKLCSFHLSTLTTAAVDVATKPDNYVYGAVAAPDWVLPVGAVLVILTAAIPILLSPGEKALDQQRINEEEVNSQFNKNKKRDLL